VRYHDRAEPPDVVLLDVQSDINGYECAGASGRFRAFADARDHDHCADQTEDRVKAMDGALTIS